MQFDFLDRIADKFLHDIGNDVLSRAKANASFSSRIPNALSLSSITKDSEGIYHIELTVDIKKAPHARAVEFGSGLHGPEKKTYQIWPVNASALAFFWPKWDPIEGERKKFLGKGKDGRLLFRYVDHPGVPARPYIAPAIKSVKGSIKGRLSGLVGKSVVDTVFETWKND